MVSLIAIAVAGWLVTLLRQDYSDPAKRKTIGALWDVGTFWPRAVPPLGPPCYAERAVPEVVGPHPPADRPFGHNTNDVATLKYQAGLPDLGRTKDLTVPTGPLLLAGYSQGSVIAPAVVAQLPADVLPEVALLTLACPAQRLYGRAFPTYFGQRQLTELARLLDADQKPGRWKNLRRRSDYIGSFIFAEPGAQAGRGIPARPRRPAVPGSPVLVQDANPSPPPTHRHSQFWPDPRTTEVGSASGRAAREASPLLSYPSPPGQAVQAANGVGHLGLVGEQREDGRAPAAACRAASRSRSAQANARCPVTRSPGSARRSSSRTDSAERAPSCPSHPVSAVQNERSRS